MSNHNLYDVKHCSFRDKIMINTNYNCKVEPPGSLQVCKLRNVCIICNHLDKQCNIPLDQLLAEKID